MGGRIVQGKEQCWERKRMCAKKIWYGWGVIISHETVSSLLSLSHLCTKPPSWCHWRAWMCSFNMELTCQPKMWGCVIRERCEVCIIRWLICLIAAILQILVWFTLVISPLNILNSSVSVCKTIAPSMQFFGRERKDQWEERECLEDWIQNIYGIIFIGQEVWVGRIREMEFNLSFIETPLHFASACGFIEGVSSLLKAGAEINVKNVKGERELIRESECEIGDEN